MDDSMMMTDLAVKQRPWYEQPMKLSDIRSCISASFQSMKREYVAIGYYLKRAEQEALYLEDRYSSIWEFAQEEYGLSKSSASRYMSINTKFSVDGNSPILQEQYKAYSKSQLQEMLYLEDEKLEQVNPEMRVQDIREMRQPKEKAYNIPYFELEGQLNIEKDFPEYLPDVMRVRPEADATLPSSSFTMDISDMLPTLGVEESVAISQQQDEQMISAPLQTDVAGDCQYRPGYPCSLTMDQQAITGDEGQCGSGCCWNCEQHGNCNIECYSSAQRPEMDYDVRAQYCRAAARKLIEAKYDWMREDYKNRVLLVDESERQLKELLLKGNSFTWYFSNPYGASVAHVNFFPDYIQFFNGDCGGWVGDCSWFYLCAAIQGMWNEIALDKAGSVAISQQGSQDEDIPPDEGYSIGNLPQAKESLLYQLAQILVEQRGQMIRAKSFGAIPSDGVITGEIRTLTRQADGEVGLKDGAGAYASAEIIEFFLGSEDLGVCTYARFATQARKAFSEWESREKQAAETEEEKPAVIDAEFTEVDDPQDKDMTDLEIARQELERANNLLIKCLSDLPDENNIYIRGMKLKVAALASLVHDLDDIENPPPKPEQPELPILRNNDQRKEWLENFRSWPVWFEVPEASEVYYRYNLPDGSSIVICEYRRWIEWMERYADENPDKAGEREYLLKPGYHYLYDCLTNRPVLIEKLKEIQKKG